MNKTVIFRSPLLTQSGYGVHARQIGKWLLRAQEKFGFELYTELLNWGSTHWLVDFDDDIALLAQNTSANSNIKRYDVSLQLQLPNEWSNTIADFNIGFTAGVETTKAPDAWGRAVNLMNLVIVPSEFTKNGLVAAGAEPNKIVVIPESFPDSFLDDSSEGILDLDLSTDFNFLCVGQMTGNNVQNDRKNIPMTMELFARAFEGNDKVGLIVKTNFGANSKLDKKFTLNIFNEMIAKISPKGPKFYLLHGPMNEKEMFGLYTHPKIKAFLSLTRGEGFGLPLLEAAVCELPIIATQWSAHTEFLNKGFWLPVQAEITNIHESRVDEYFMKDSKWAEPNMSVAAQRLTKFFAKSELPKKLTKELSAVLKKEYSSSAIQKIYDEKLSKYLVK